MSAPEATFLNTRANQTKFIFFSSLRCSSFVRVGVCGRRFTFTFSFRSIFSFLPFLLLCPGLRLSRVRLSQNLRVLSLLVAHGLELDDVENVALALRILQLLNQVVVALASLLRLDMLLDLLLGHAARHVAAIVRTLLARRGRSLQVFLAAGLGNSFQEARVDLLLVLAERA